MNVDVRTVASTTSSGLMTNLRIVSEDCIYEMSLSVDSTIGDIRRRVSRERYELATDVCDTLADFKFNVYSRVYWLWTLNSLQNSISHRVNWQ
jgi:hypothetical protein